MEKELEIFPGTNRNKRYANEEANRRVEQVRYNTATHGKVRKSSRKSKGAGAKLLAGTLVIVALCSFLSKVDKNYESMCNEAGISREYIGSGSSSLDTVFINSETGKIISDDELPSFMDAASKTADDIKGDVEEIFHGR